MARRQCAAKRPRHYQERSAVVTRRPEPVMARIPRPFGKFSISDTALNGSAHRFQKKALHHSAGLFYRHAVVFVLA